MADTCVRLRQSCVQARPVRFGQDDCTMYTHCLRCMTWIGLTNKMVETCVSYASARVSMSKICNRYLAKICPNHLDRSTHDQTFYPDFGPPNQSGPQVFCPLCPPPLAGLGLPNLQSFQLGLTLISRILLVYYCKCCNLIGYSTRYLFTIRQRVAKQSSF